MSLQDYAVKRDKFEYDDSSVFDFPCTVCKSKTKQDTDEPCRTCDHNANAVKEARKR